MLKTKHSNASQLTQRTLFDLPDAFSADAKHGGDFLDRVLTFVRDGQRAVSRGLQPVLAVTAMLEVVAALGLATGSGAVAVRAFIDQRETARLPSRQLMAVGPRIAHVSL